MEKDLQRYIVRGAVVVLELMCLVRQIRFVSCSMKQITCLTAAIVVCATRRLIEFCKQKNYDLSEFTFTDTKALTAEDSKNAPKNDEEEEAEAIKTITSDVPSSSSENLMRSGIVTELQSKVSATAIRVVLLCFLFLAHAVVADVTAL